ncbi:MAG: DUF58 domain-containing protein [Spirochaetes bacterium]|nr:DUF58 domain-containing protein [Spirochaetota bacterium]
MKPVHRLQLLASGVLLALAILTLEGRWLLPAIVPVLWLIVGRLRPPLPPQLQLERVFEPACPAPGQSCRVSLHVKNCGADLAWLRLADTVPAEITVIDGVTHWQGSLESDSAISLNYTIRANRGIFQFSSVTCASSDNFWLWEQEQELAADSVLFVPIPSAQLKPNLSAGSALRLFPGISGVRRAGEGSEFYGIRDYLPGDPLRTINWRAGARWNQQKVNIYEAERAIDLGIILDCRSESYETEPDFDNACSVAQTLACCYLDGGNRVALMLYGADLAYCAPGSGKQQKQRIKELCAGARLGDHLAFDYLVNLPLQLFPPRSLLAMVSPLRAADVFGLRHMRAQGYALVAVRPISPLITDSQSIISAKEDPDAGEQLALEVHTIEEELLVKELLHSGIVLQPYAGGNPVHLLAPLGGSHHA